MRKTRGFAAIEIILVLVVIALIAFIAWRLVLNNQTEATVPQNVVTEQTSPKVETTSDLDTLSTDLDAAEIDDGTTTTQLEIESAF